MMNTNQISDLDIDYKAIFTAAPDLYLLLNPKFVILDASDAYIHATLVKRNEIIGRNIFDVFPDNPDDPAATGVKNLRASLENVLKYKKPNAMAVQKYDVRNSETGEFEKRYWIPTNSPVLDSNNEVKYIIHRAEDVTKYVDLKEAETKNLNILQELRTHAGKMELEIFQRTQEIQEVNRQLEKTAQKLMSSNEQLREFAYVTSHDLQEPLRMVGSYMQLLKKRYQNKLDKDADEFIFYAVDGVERMKALINSLLMYSRIETQGKPFEKIPMQQALNWALANLQTAIEETKAKIIFDQLPSVSGDPIQLGQLWQNLIGNALRYHEANRPIEIHAGVIEKQDHWQFFLKDNGIGIEPQYHQRVFKIFQRLHTNQEYQGTGIGLSVCKRIVERHNGRIWIESQLGQGATFYFTFQKIEA